MQTKRVFTVVAWASFVTLVVVTVFGIGESLYGTKQAVGYYFVNVYWPFPPYFAQPVTYFSVASIALFYSGLRLWQERIARWPPAMLSFLQLFGFVVAFSSAYEVLYNFMLWGAYCVLSQCTNPDVVTSNFPAPWSLVFATRAFAALFVISGYSVYFLRLMSKSSLI